MSNNFAYNNVTVGVEADKAPIAGRMMSCRAVFYPDMSTLQLTAASHRLWRNQEVFRSPHLVVTRKRDGGYRTEVHYHPSEPGYERLVGQEFAAALEAVRTHEESLSGRASHERPANSEEKGTAA